MKTNGTRTGMPSRGRRIAVASGLFLTLLLLAFLPGADAQDSSPASMVVELRFFAFQPNQTSVQVGTEVVFQNRQEETHQFIWRNQPLPAVTLVPGDSWRWQFDTPGVYEFRCLYDSADFERGMRGRIVVVQAPATLPAGARLESNSPGPDWRRLAGIVTFYGPPLLGLLWLWRRPSGPPPESSPDVPSPMPDPNGGASSPQSFAARLKQVSRIDGDSHSSGGAVAQSFAARRKEGSPIDQDAHPAGGAAVILPPGKSEPAAVEEVPAVRASTLDE